MILDCDGRYVQISASSGTLLASGLYGGLTEPQTHIGGCTAADVLDTDRNVVYAVMPESARVDEDGAQRFFVATLDVKTLTVVGKYELPNKQAALPVLMADPSGMSLLVAFGDGSDQHWQRLTVQSDSALSPSGPAVTIKIGFPTTSDPYINGQGNIVDGLRTLDPQGRLIREVRADSILDAALQEKFTALTQIKNSSRHYNGTIPAAFAANRIVFTVGWDTASKRVSSAGVVVYDANADRVISSFFSAFPVAPGYAGGGGVPSLHLTPDGKRVIVEQYAWRAQSAEESRPARFRTGRLAIYDADTGALTATLDVESSRSPRADGRVVNFSSDSRYLYYWFDKHLFVINLESARVISAATLPEGFDPEAVVRNNR